MRQGLMQPPTGAAPVEPPMPGPGQQAGPAPAPEQVDSLSGEFEQASPAEQKQYEKLMETFFGLIHSEKTRDMVVKRIREEAPEKLGATIGEMALAMFTSVEGQIEKQGREISESVKLEAGQDLILELVQVAVAAGVVPDDEEVVGVVVADAIDVMVSRYGKLQADRGKIDPAYAKDSLNSLTQEAGRQFAKSPLATAVAGAQPQGAPV